MRLIKTTFILFSFIALFACNEQQREANENNETSSIVTFKGRKVNLGLHLEGFPYSVQQFYLSYESGKAYYMKDDTITQLMETDINANPDLSKGKVISDINFSSRNAFKLSYNRFDGLLYWLGDEKNDEQLNLFRLNTATKELEKITNVPYIYGYDINRDKNLIAYIARLGVNNEQNSEIRILDVGNNTEEIIISDNKEMRYTWGDPLWKPDGKGLIVCANKNSNRAYGNLVYINLTDKTQTVLLDPEIARSMVSIGNPTLLTQWINENEFIYLSNEDGYFNLYKYNLKERSSSQVTHFNTDIGTAELLDINSKKNLFVSTSSPIETNLYLIDPVSGDILSQQKSEITYSIKATDKNKVLVSAVSNSSVFRIDEITINDNTFNTDIVFDVPEDIQKKIYTANPERVSYSTFDIDPATGTTRKIHGYLYHPKKPLPKEEQIVMIQSFYGGYNMFSNEIQILADAGIYVFSPSPRGSFFLGKEFVALNDGDLGGNEIVDIIYAAKYISEKLDIPPDRIGVFGTSHGGYATMRALTFPGEVNGTKAEFNWGFGISTAGFSDIIHFYNHCNIPDWVTLEAGNPETEAEKLKDRSPLYHADKVKGALLLIHGSNDQRVPVEGSRMMADSLSKYNKKFRFIEIEGQGHGVKGLENNVFYYQSIFYFIEEVTK